MPPDPSPSAEPQDILGLVKELAKMQKSTDPNTMFSFESERFYFNCRQHIPAIATFCLDQAEKLRRAEELLRETTTERDDLMKERCDLHKITAFIIHYIANGKVEITQDNFADMDFAVVETEFDPTTGNMIFRSRIKPHSPPIK